MKPAHSNFHAVPAMSSDAGCTPMTYNNYAILSKIGRGSFSEVYCAQHVLSKKLVALKVLRHGFDDIGRNELQHLRMLQDVDQFGDQYFVKTLDGFECNGQICIAFELYPATLLSFMRLRTPGDIRPHEQQQQEHRWLDQHHGKPHSSKHYDSIPISGRLHGNASMPSTAAAKLSFLPVSDCHSLSVPKPDNGFDLPVFRRICFKLLTALCALRTQGIIHADVKPENCFLDVLHSDAPQAYCGAGSLDSSGAPLSMRALGLREFAIRLGDFGNSLHETGAQHYFGSFKIQSLPYRAPEVLVGVPFDAQIDVWSLGVLLTELCLGCELFPVQSPESLFYAIASQIAPMTNTPLVEGKFYTDLQRKACMAYGYNTPPAHVSADEHRSVAHLLRFVPVQSGALMPQQTLPPLLLDFLARMLRVDPRRRITPFNALRHPFLRPELVLPPCLLVANTQCGRVHNFNPAAPPSREEVELVEAKRFRTCNDQCSQTMLDLALLHVKPESSDCRTSPTEPPLTSPLSSATAPSTPTSPAEAVHAESGFDEAVKLGGQDDDETLTKDSTPIPEVTDTRCIASDASIERNHSARPALAPPVYIDTEDATNQRVSRRRGATRTEQAISFIQLAAGTLFNYSDNNGANTKQSTAMHHHVSTEAQPPSASTKDVVGSDSSVRAGSPQAFGATNTAETTMTSSATTSRKRKAGMSNSAPSVLANICDSSLQSSPQTTAPTTTTTTTTASTPNPAAVMPNSSRSKRMASMNSYSLVHAVTLSGLHVHGSANNVAKLSSPNYQAMYR